MNYQYPIPGSQAGSSRPTYIADGTKQFPALVKSPEEIIQATFDFSQLQPSVTVVGCWARVRPGGEPQLAIGPLVINTAATSNIVTANVKGGVPGRTYDVEINIRGSLGGVYSFFWVVNVTGDDCGCAVATAPPLNGVVSGDGSLIVNEAPKFYVSGTEPVGANVLDRWYNTTTGATFDYISNGIYSFWVPAGGGGSGGGGGGGGSIGSNVNIVSIVPITPDGVTTVFTLTSTVGVAVNIIATNTLFMSVDGVWQNAATQYTAAGNQVAFVQPPSADSSVFMLWFAPAP